jgi:CRISPR-associated exonuclease Cas4
MSGGILVVLILLALALYWRAQARRLVGRSARPEQVVHVDTGRNDRTLTSHRYGLTGRPDFLLEENGECFPMERKSRHLTDRGPYDGERLQLAAYCLLLEEDTAQPVRRGRLEYVNRTVDIPFDTALRAALLETLDALKQHQHARDVRRSHAHPARCCACGFRARCAESLSA